MSTRAELDAALAKAEAGWRNANDELEEVQSARARATANWDNVVKFQHRQEVDRRRTGPDRRRADASGRVFPDQRNAGYDRRREKADFIAFSKVVADRHEAYLARNNAETAWAAAVANLHSAIVEREKAVAALNERAEDASSARAPSANDRVTPAGAPLRIVTLLLQS